MTGDIGAPMVRAVGVRKSFGRHQVLKGIDLEVAAGEVVALLGPSGSGKSTFLRCINHLETIDGGEIAVAGNLVGYRRQNGKKYELRPGTSRPRAVTWGWSSSASTCSTT